MTSLVADNITENAIPKTYEIQNIFVSGEQDRIAELAETEEIKKLRKLYLEENKMAYEGEDILSFIITLSGVCDQKIYEGKEAAIYFEILDTRDFLLEIYSKLTDTESLRYKKEVEEAIQEANDKLIFFINKIF